MRHAARIPLKPALLLFGALVFMALPALIAFAQA
jgi:hypothetical protein